MNNTTEKPVRNPSRSVERVEKLLLRAKALYGDCFAGSPYRAAAALLNGESIGNILLITAPGRINLIGEHTDYNNCPVLPMAVDREIIAVSIPDSQGIFRIADADPKYGEIRFSLADYQEAPAIISEKSNGTGIPPYETGHWGNYFKAAVNEMIGSGYPVTNGFSMVFSSTIPLAAGMSSSSALVVLAALGTASANGIETESQAARLQLAEMCRKAEWYTGTMGGGMDQAAILLGSRNHAVKIDFAPLQVKPVPFPPGYTVVVTHSTVEAPKTRETMDLYNRRSIECRIAAAAAAKRLSDAYGTAALKFIGDLTPEKTGIPSEKLEPELDALFSPEPCTEQEAAALTGLSSQELIGTYCRRRDGSQFPVPEDGFKLYQRFKHVREEWARVEESVKLLEAGDMAAFGELMNASHVSCRDLHEISCPELDVLTTIAVEAGALGSRLTGAGFGGCAVNLVRDDEVSIFIETLLDRFYGAHLNIPREDALKYIFPVHSESGAGVLTSSGAGLG